MTRHTSPHIKPDPRSDGLAMAACDRFRDRSQRDAECAGDVAIAQAFGAQEKQRGRDRAVARKPADNAAALEPRPSGPPDLRSRSDRVRTRRRPSTTRRDARGAAACWRGCARLEIASRAGSRAICLVGDAEEGERTRPARCPPHPPGSTRATIHSAAARARIDRTTREPPRRSKTAESADSTRASNPVAIANGAARAARGSEVGHQWPETV